MDIRRVEAKALGYATAYALLEGEVVAFMQRSPFTGHWCYGARMDGGFRPALQTTRCKTATCAAKVAIYEIESSEGQDKG